MMLLFIAVLIKGLRNNSDLVIVGYCCGVLSLCLHGWVDFNFHIPANMLLFTIWVACIRSCNSGDTTLNSTV
jgi:hypothetical protein